MDPLDKYHTDKNAKTVESVLELIAKYKSQVKNISPVEKNVIYSYVKSIIDHTYWYTEDQITLVRNEAISSGLFTKKQCNSFKKSSIPDDYED